MEKRKFKTLIKADHKLGRNDYVVGRISGIQLVLLGEFGENFKEFANLTNAKTGDRILSAIATKEDYDNFAYRVEKNYPGLCIFDYEK